MSSSNTSLALSGLASGFDWQSLVSQLIQVERTPETRLRTQQTTYQQKNSAYTSIGTQMTALGTSLQTLQDATLFNSRNTTLSDSTVATATAADSAALGSYTFNITQMATSAVQQGALDGGKPLSASNNVAGVVLGNAGLASAISAGNFTVNGKSITIATTDTLQSVFDQINTVTGGTVTGSYDSTTDTISLNSGSPIVLGSATDTSNFLQATKLYNNGSGIITSTSALGAIKMTGDVGSANFNTAVTDGGAGAGAFMINGVTINFNSSADSVSDILNRISDSAAGVTASYDSINDRFLLTNKTTGDMGISLQDVTGNFLAATGLSSGTLQRGANLQYNINGGGTLTSLSNTITQDSSGLTGLSVTALKLGTTTVGVGSDTTKIKAAITDFVTKYNAVQKFIDSQTTSTTDSSGKVTASILTGDLDASDMETKLRRMATNTPPGQTGAVLSLDSLGIVSNGTDNTLSLTDTTKLDNALAGNLSAVKSLFTDATNGVAVNMNTYVTGLTGDNGIITTKETDLTKASSDIDTNIAAMERKILDDQDRMTSEFVAMETAQAQINQQKDYLTSAFGGGTTTTG
jgi:flagellar hook-associated protein 2